MIQGLSWPIPEQSNVPLTKEQHLKKARDNETFLTTVDTSAPVGIGWAITIKFYIALHYIQAYMVSNNQDFVRHKNRGDAVERDPRIRNAYDDYRELYDNARDARYEDCDDLAIGHLTHADECLTAVKNVVLPLL